MSIKFIIILGRHLFFITQKSFKTEVTFQKRFHLEFKSNQMAILRSPVWVAILDLRPLRIPVKNWL